LTWGAFGQVQSSSGESLIGFHWKPGRHSVEIPFELHANLIVIPLRINDSDTLRFLVDTGLGATLLTDTTVVSTLGLKSIRTVELNGLGIHKSLQAHVVIDTKLQVGPAYSLHQNIIYISDDLLNLSSSIGTKIQGIIGYDLFANVVVTIDYARSRLILTQPVHYRYKKRKGFRLPIDMSDNKPYLNQAGLTGLQGKLPNRILLDTGAGHVLLVEAGVADSLQFKYADQRVNLGKGLNGPIIGRWGRVPSLAIGPWSWPQVPAIFPDSMARKSTDPWQASLGGEFFRRFKLTFHYLDQYVVIKPIGNQWKKDFEYGMSGIGLRAIGPAYRRFIVETVHAGSPSDKAGILPGDEIWLLNNKRVDQYRLGDIYRLLKKREGDVIELMIRRDRTFQIVQFQLRKLF
jgi:predicted aspartyl protease